MGLVWNGDSGFLFNMQILVIKVLRVAPESGFQSHSIFQPCVPNFRKAVVKVQAGSRAVYFRFALMQIYA